LVEFSLAQRFHWLRNGLEEGCSVNHRLGIDAQNPPRTPNAGGAAGEGAPAVALNFASAPPTQVGDSSQQKYTAQN